MDGSAYRVICGVVSEDKIDRWAVLRCKVGDLVYHVNDNRIRDVRIVKFTITASGLFITYRYNYMGYCEGTGILGEDIFTTLESAERELERRHGKPHDYNETVK